MSYWTSEATGSIIISPLSVRPFVTQLISETAPRIFSKLGIKLGENKGKKIEVLFLKKIIILPKFGLTCQKMAILAKIAVFLILQKNSSNKLSISALKVGPKIVL